MSPDGRVTGDPFIETLRVCVASAPVASVMMVTAHVLSVGRAFSDLFFKMNFHTFDLFLLVLFVSFWTSAAVADEICKDITNNNWIGRSAFKIATVFALPSTPAAAVALSIEGFEVSIIAAVELGKAHTNWQLIRRRVPCTLPCFQSLCFSIDGGGSTSPGS